VAVPVDLKKVSSISSAKLVRKSPAGNQSETTEKTNQKSFGAVFLSASEKAGKDLD
jgi:hypothetical protein